MYSNWQLKSLFPLRNASCHLRAGRQISTDEYTSGLLRDRALRKRDQRDLPFVSSSGADTDSTLRVDRSDWKNLRTAEVTSILSVDISSNLPISERTSAEEVLPVTDQIATSSSHTSPPTSFDQSRASSPVYARPRPYPWRPWRLNGTLRLQGQDPRVQFVCTEFSEPLPCMVHLDPMHRMEQVYIVENAGLCSELLEA